MRQNRLLNLQSLEFLMLYSKSTSTLVQQNFFQSSVSASLFHRNESSRTNLRQTNKLMQQ